MIRVSGRLHGVAQTVSAVNQIPSLLQQAGVGAMTETLQFMSTTVRHRFLRGPYPSEIERHTGGFAATFARGHRENIFEVQAEGTRIRGTFGSRDIRARVLDEGTGFLSGGVIRPTRGQFLAIPTDLARTSPRGPLKQQYRNRSWRDVPNTFVGRSRRGGLFIAERAIASGRQRQSRLRILAWLVKSVRIIGRRFMQKTEDVTRPQIVPIFQARFDRVIARANQLLGRFGR